MGAPRVAGPSGRTLAFQAAKIASLEPQLKILILSPHRDDAAFSLSLSMHNWLTARHSITVLTVFTRSRFAPYSDAAFVHENDQLSYVSAMRLREDELFLRRITQDLPKGLKSNLRMIDLNLKDGPIRLRIPPEELSTTPVNPADPSIEKIRKALTQQTMAGSVDALVVPLGLGGDVDHLTVRAAALPFTTGRLVAFYEDLPYAADLGAPEVLDVAARSAADPDFPLSEAFCLSQSAVERKRSLILGYASQIDAEAAQLISGFAARYGGERLWAEASWQAAAEANRMNSLERLAEK